MATDQELTGVSLPIAEETVTVDKKKRVSGKVAATIRAVEDAFTIDEHLVNESVNIERLAVDRWVDAPVPVRHEGNTTIVSIMEEVVVVEKRWKVVEEIHLTKRENIRHEPQQVVVRRTEATVERLPPDPDGSA
ncbi:YsnF/AvaK domain-containing protein [Azospirillum sp. sgz301742]